MYRITAPRAIPDALPRATPLEGRVMLAVLALMALALLSWYVYVLQDQVLRAQEFRAQLQQSATLVATAKAPGRRPAVIASRR